MNDESLDSLEAGKYKNNVCIYKKTKSPAPSH